MRKTFSKVWHGVLVLWWCFMLLFGTYQLYSAWMFQVLYGGRLGSISYDMHPVGFWCCILFYIFSMVVLAVATVLMIGEKQAENRFFRKREMQPPIEHVIRQPTSER